MKLKKIEYEVENTVLTLRSGTFIGLGFCIWYNGLYTPTYCWITLPFFDICITICRKYHKIFDFTGLW